MKPPTGVNITALPHAPGALEAPFAVTVNITDMEWEVRIEPIEGHMPFGRWRVYLLRGVMRYGLDGWGWTTYTLRGARRKAARELSRRKALDERMARRKALVKGDEQ